MCRLLLEKGVRISAIQSAIFSELSFAYGAESLSVSDRETGGMIASMTRPKIEEFQLQLDYVNAYADLRIDRAPEILAQVGEIMSFIGQAISLHPQRHRWTIEYLFVAVGAVIELEKRFKAAMNVRRPFELAPQIQPMITTPAHSAFPSGHSTEAFAMAEVLASMVDHIDAVQNLSGPGSRRWLMVSQAARVAVNRTVAGVHFPVDTLAGATLGTALGQYMVARSQSGTAQAPLMQMHGLSFDSPWDAASRPQSPDFNLAVFQSEADPANQESANSRYVETGSAFTVPSCAPLAWLWSKAAEEWVVAAACDTATATS